MIPPPNLVPIEILLIEDSPTDALLTKEALAEAKLLKPMLSRANAFSSTQRMERSSSMIQTGFMLRYPCCGFLFR